MPDQLINPTNIIQGLLGLLIIILSGLFTWSLTRINTLNDKNAEISTQIALMQQSLDTMNENNGADVGQDSQLSKHWKIVSFHKDQINELRAKQGLPFVSWPPLD